jgi:hypothetical protein
VTPELVGGALSRAVPEFRDGRLVLHGCTIRRLRLDERLGTWHGAILLAVADGTGRGAQPAATRVVTLHATVLPPKPAASGWAGPPQGEAGPAEREHTPGSYTFGDPRWRCCLSELGLELRTQQTDAELATLPQLTDPAAARALLEAAIRAGDNADYRDLTIAACRPRVARYKPGSRCTVLYQLEYAAEAADQRDSRAWPDVVVAKTYHGDKGNNAYAGMRALWRSPLGHSSTVRIAEPLAWLPELNVLVQGPIREELTLKELLYRELHAYPYAAQGGAPEIAPELAHYIGKAAAGLAELHRCGVGYGEEVTWEDELAKIYKQRAKLAGPLPELATAAEELLNRLQAIAAVHPADAPAPAHRSFRPAQVLLAGGEIGFIDFDGFCQAEPALDLALFMATVKNLGINKAGADDEDEDERPAPDGARHLAGLQFAEAVCELFLAEYERHAPVSRTRVLLWEALDLLSLVFGSWTKLKLARLDNCLFLLERHPLCKA